MAQVALTRAWAVERQTADLTTAMRRMQRDQSLAGRVA